jgi:hypothetical protein
LVKLPAKSVYKDTVSGPIGKKIVKCSQLLHLKLIIIAWRQKTVIKKAMKLFQHEMGVTHSNNCKTLILCLF